MGAEEAEEAGEVVDGLEPLDVGGLDQVAVPDCSSQEQQKHLQAELWVIVVQQGAALPGTMCLCICPNVHPEHPFGFQSDASWI